MNARAEKTTPMPEIVKRDLKFDLEARDLRTWHPEGLHVAHFFNALSIFFPEGESLFIDAVRRYADRVDSPALQRDVAGFLGQEAMHSREHRRYNRALAKAGLPAEELERKLTWRLDLLRKYASPADQLAVTIALEHFTAIMADTLLADDRILEGADPCLSAVWRWHAIEETEHKAVAYDVYRQAMAGKGYWRRVGIMLVTTLVFWSQVFLYHFRLVRADGAAGDVRGWWKLFRFLWVNPGTMRKLFRPWLAYFRRGFHPWQDDNRHLVESWKAAYEAEGRVSA